MLRLEPLGHLSYIILLLTRN
uniref:Uncharacterized protein n=1 Tax=Arundo donax TaxID=35708 RepID=A0A0A9FQT2_ARUDO